MYWLHCNGCYCQPEPGVELRFHITNCSHIYCEKCVTECTKERCKVCQSQCASLELSGKLQKEVENLFDEPSNILEKAVKQVNRTQDFQKSHQRRWCRHLREMVKQQAQQLKEVKKLTMYCRNIEKELMEAKKENSYLKCLLAKSDLRVKAQVVAGLDKTGARAGNYQGASPNQSLFGRGVQQQTLNMNTGNMNRNGAVMSSSSVLHRPGRILMRTPPSGGKMGTTRNQMSYMTPGSVEAVRTAITPLNYKKSNELHDPRKCGGCEDGYNPTIGSTTHLPKSK